MSEHLNLNLGGEPFEMTPDNASLFTFVGQGALYNHVFLQQEELEENRVRGTYVFSTSQSFQPLMNFMLEQGYPMHLNLRQVAQCDQDAYEQVIAQQLDDLDSGLPEGWA